MFRFEVKKILIRAQSSFSHFFTALPMQEFLENSGTIRSVLLIPEKYLCYPVENAGTFCDDENGLREGKKLQNRVFRNSVTFVCSF